MRAAATEKQELHLLRQQRDFTRKIHMLLVEFLTVEGLFDQWSVFTHARINGTPYTPLYGLCTKG